MTNVMSNAIAVGDNCKNFETKLLMNKTEQIQVQAITDAGNDGLVTGFFAIGMVINILLVTAYLIWAYKQWGKKEKRDK